MNKTKVTKDLEHKTLIIERKFNAPKAKVWQAYAEQELFEKWWGPEGWETTTKEFDFKPGGRIHYCMKCVDKNQTEWFGKESWGLMEVERIDAPTSFSVIDFFTDASGTIDTKMPTQRFSVELVEENGTTNLITRSIANSREDLEKLIKMGMVEGFDSQLNKLEQMLAE